MDLLKEEKRLIEKKHKALENLEKKKKYLGTIAKSVRKAKREFRLAAAELNVIRKRIKVEGIERPADVIINTPGVVPTPIEEQESMAEKPKDE